MQCLAGITLLLIVLPLPSGTALQPLRSAHAQAQSPCPNLPSSSPGLDFSNKDLSGMNFSGRDLRMANFSGSTLKGTVFINADLSGANFSGARVLPSEREDLRPTDFTGAKLSNACFAAMSFKGRSYFTYADVSCADFSRNNLSSGLAIFGPSPLKIDADSACKPSFRGTVMHCEFVPDWPRLDLGAGSGSAGAGAGAGADLSACATDLAGLRLDGAMLDGVNLSGAVLDGVSLAGASLKEARLDNAQQCVDLHDANLQGASLSPPI